MKINTNINAGKIGMNRNPPALRVKTKVKAGGRGLNHNQNPTTL